MKTLGNLNDAGEGSDMCTLSESNINKHASQVADREAMRGNNLKQRGVGYKEEEPKPKCGRGCDCLVPRSLPNNLAGYRQKTLSPLTDALRVRQH